MLVQDCHLSAELPFPCVKARQLKGARPGNETKFEVLTRQCAGGDPVLLL